MASLFALMLASLCLKLSYLYVEAGDIDMQGPVGAYTNYSDGSCSISMTNSSNGGWGSRSQYVHGVFSAMIKLPGPFTPGVATTFYMYSQANGDVWDEIDFELLGAQYPVKYLIHTNYHAGDQGSHEEQFNVWFDPTEDYHNYTIIWNWNSIVWMVDGIPLRSLQLNSTQTDPNARDTLLQPCTVQASIWDASPWATDCGAAKVDYNFSPFTAYYKSIDFSNACPYDGADSPCMDPKNSAFYNWSTPLTAKQERLMKAFRKRYLHYSFQRRLNPCGPSKGHHVPVPSGRRLGHHFQRVARLK
eukprot:TRINITY_DN7028_c0_g1_i2.p1 TRINITY_DN7028_c0_g1~~TRINITY_DN7028_c0_g1_i2.p1  ORF type:complete len:334 (+),score=31.79 TRINITY_DN7028_c0_g1_i2:97-1002(+)